MEDWVIVPPFVVAVPYLGALYRAAWLLPGERTRLGDARPVPNLLGPMNSYRWLGILFSEDTRAFRPQTRQAFTLARIALALFPVALFVSVTLAQISVSGEKSDQSTEHSIPLSR